ncbi:MAG: replication initiation protein [Promethearchaeota archaeon]
MLNEKNEAIIHQEPQKINKPDVLVNIALNKALTAKDKKIYNLIIRKLLSHNYEDLLKNEIRTSISEISRDLGILNRMDIYKILDILGETTIKFLEVFEDKQFLTKAKMISSYSRPVETLEDYNDESTNISHDNLIIRFDTHLTKTILKYSEKYAKLDINDLNNLKGSHSITLYEIFIKSLKTFEFKKKNMTEQELRILLHLEDKYLDIKSFNNQVIKKSINEINSKTKLSISYKRVKQNKENIYKFEINQDYKFNFKKFKKCILENYYNFSFFYKNNQYSFAKDLDDKNAQYLIVNHKKQNTIQKEKAEEIYQFMYALLNDKILKFVQLFLIEKNLSKENYSISDLDENDLEEVDLFMENYEKTI